MPFFTTSRLVVAKCFSSHLDLLDTPEVLRSRTHYLEDQHHQAGSKPQLSCGGLHGITC